MDIKKTIAVALLCLSAGSAFAVTIVTQSVMNVHGYLKGSTTLTFSGQLDEEAMGEVASGKSMAVYNNLYGYLVYPAAFPKTKTGLGLNYNSKVVSINFKSGRSQWSEKDLTNFYVFSVGEKLIKPESAAIRSAGKVQPEGLAGISGKKLTILDLREKELGEHCLAALNFTPLLKGKNYKYSCKENGVQAKVTINPAGRMNAQFKLSPDVAALVSFENEGVYTNKYNYRLKIVGDGNVEASYAGPDRVLLRVTENFEKFRYFQYSIIKKTNTVWYADLPGNSEIRAVFGNYDFKTVVEGRGNVQTEFMGPDEVKLRALGGEDEFYRFAWGSDSGYCSPLTFSFTSDTVATATFLEASYLVVDLSGGSEAEEWPCRITNTPPDVKNEACRTTELWMKYVSPGVYSMGSPTSERGRGNREDAHRVTLSKGFYIGVFEMTRTQYKIITGEDPAFVPGDNRPVVNISFTQIRGADKGMEWPQSDEVDSNSFMGIMRAKTGLRFDLPTEGQWEYACRATTLTAFSNGYNLYESGLDLGAIACYHNNSDGAPMRVGSRNPNKWGLYDMHGNVWEWCLDWYVDNLGFDPCVDPAGLPSGTTKTTRGGSYKDSGEQLRSAYRSYLESENALDRLGFRPVINL